MFDYRLSAYSRRQLFANAVIVASRRGVAVRRGPILMMPEGSVHIQGAPTDAAAAFMMSLLYRSFIVPFKINDTPSVK